MAALCNKIATETMQSIHPMVFLILTEGSETTLRNPKVPASDFDQYTVYSIDWFRLAPSFNSQVKRCVL